MKEKYDFELQCDLSNSEAIMTAIREQFGFEITTANRPVEVLVVGKNLTGSY